MENILTNINKLNGVHHVCIYRDGNDVLSTFPDDHHNIESMAQMVEQVFSALQAINKSHDELYFSVEDKLLAAYLMHDSYIAILLTEKKINFPLIHMGIRSASAKIKRYLALQPKAIISEAEELKKEVPKVAQEKVEEGSSNADISISKDPQLDYVLDQILTELINYFGPAAKFVLEDTQIQWETKYVKNLNNIPELGEILQEELDTAEEKRAFSQFITKILR